MTASAVRVKSPRDLRTERRRRSHSCWDHLIAAPLWPLHNANLGTLLRTCDAVGACLAVPRLPWVPEALARGNTLRKPACVHWTGDQLTWLAKQKARADTTIVGAELADEAIRLADLPTARNRTVLVLGHERDGIPPDAVELLDLAVEIPMIGTGASLNVAVAGRWCCIGWRGWCDSCAWTGMSDPPLSRPGPERIAALGAGPIPQSLNP